MNHLANLIRRFNNADMTYGDSGYSDLKIQINYPLLLEPIVDCQNADAIRKRKFPKKADAEEACRLYRQGLTQKEVARILSVSRRTVGNYLHEHGVKSRTRKRISSIERRQTRKKNARKRRQKVHEFRAKLFGTTCKICGVSKDKLTIAIHRKDCSEHDVNALWKLPFLQSLNPDEWIALCIACHRGVHWVDSELGFDWSIIEILLQKKLNDAEAGEKSLDHSRVSQSRTKRELSAPDIGDSVESIRKGIFGQDCYFCKKAPKTNRLVIHRKDGTKHRDSLLWSKQRLKELNPEEWVAICSRHHRYVHWAMNNLGLQWEDIDAAFQENEV